MHLRRNFIIFKLLIISWPFINFVELRSAANEPSLVDSLRRHYLSLDADLWKLIASGTDISFVLTQIHIIHRTFLSENFHEFNVQLASTDEQQLKLFDSFNAINTSVSVLLKNYLHTNPLEFDEKKSLRVAQIQENQTQHLDIIFNVTGLTDFYRIIQAVSIIN